MYIIEICQNKQGFWWGYPGLVIFEISFIYKVFMENKFVSSATLANSLQIARWKVILWPVSLLRLYQRVGAQEWEINKVTGYNRH